MTLPLADRAGTVTAVDAEREMLDEGARLAGAGLTGGAGEHAQRWST